MKSYKVNEAEAVFSESVDITETTDTNHADNINAAPKTVFENTVVLNREVKAIKKNMEEESGESIGYNNESSGLNAENLQEAVDELAEKTARLKELNILLNMDEKDKTLIDEAPDEGEEPPMRKVVGLER